MKKLFAIIALLSMSLIMLPARSLAAGGIYASGGKTVTVGQTFTVTIAASGANFNAAQGKISISGPVSVVSFSAGGADNWTWTSTPTNGGTFVGVLLGAGQRISSLTIATIKLKGTGVGSGSVSVSGVALEPSAGSGAGGTDFTIEKAPDLPGKVTVSSSSHPDSATAYEATTIALAWDKAAGVDGFSYLLDQAEGTTPASKITDANTSMTYANQAIGTYYFHIKAHKADGWGAVTHFKINIKEPDAKINETLAKPSQISIEKTADGTNNIKDGTLTGIVISGITEPGFTANLTFTPALTVPAGKILSAIADETGKWSVILDYPVASGFHKLSVQGQKEKILTPVSDEVTFEVSQKEGGTINILTALDEQAPVKAVQAPEKKATVSKTVIFYGIAGLALIVMIILSVILIRKRMKTKGLARSIRN